MSHPPPSYYYGAHEIARQQSYQQHSHRHPPRHASPPALEHHDEVSWAASKYVPLLPPGID